ncbi:MAG: FtsW/RodA/SpoVE family cell cycle protein [Clostridia bacterium]|nr:FtsW/RodA/SpoVE family cell cycle protein [Clostridia bacterium]
MNKKMLKNTEWSILIYVFLLIIIGLIALYSATINSELYEFKKQCIWLLISIPVMIAVMFIDYETIARFSPYLYGLSIILLVSVLFTGAINGATSWFDIGFFAIQPAELGKAFVIIFLSSMIIKIQKYSKGEINKISKLAIIIGIVLLPTILIALQPDYGTAIAYIVSLILILYVSGINKKYIIVSSIILVIAIPLLYLFVLPDHAKARIDVYLNPNLDPRGAGYNIIQSKIAIGAGKLFGMGWLKGTQTHLGFLYPKTTDFIFSMIGEELGFITCALIILIYVLLITKAINIAKTAKNDLGSYIAIGIVRNIFISYNRKYWYDYRPFANNRYTIAIY